MILEITVNEFFTFVMEIFRIDLAEKLTTECHQLPIFLVAPIFNLGFFLLVILSIICFVEFYPTFFISIVVGVDKGVLVL